MTSCYCYACAKTYHAKPLLGVAVAKCHWTWFRVRGISMSMRGAVLYLTFESGVQPCSQQMPGR
jgi:hypothetical protein